ncbi:hypothetical protein FACS1894166_08300 [Bacilli bacterium]|nr:hypothetical protein FACS1894166_08300 [Bacilli bacterium]
MAFNYVPENPLQVIGELNKLDPAKYGYSVVSYDNLSVLIDNDKETITISALAGNPMYEGTYTFAYTVNA